MRSTEVIVSQTPLNVQSQVLSVVSDRPGSPGERGDEFAQGQVGSLNEYCLYQAAQGECFQSGADQLATALANDAVEKGDAPASSSFAQLSVLQPSVREPEMFARPGWFVPEVEMVRDSVEVLVQAVAGEDGK